MFSVNEEMTSAEALDRAIDSEKLAYDWYSHVSRLCRDNGAAQMAELFSDSAEMEKSHFERLVAVKRLVAPRFAGEAAGIDRWTVKRASMSPEAEKVKRELAAGAGVEKAIEFMREVELEAERFYLLAAEKASEKHLYEIFMMLADEEAGHVREVELIGEKHRRSRD